MLATLLNRPCTITRRSPSDNEDGYGNDIPGETHVETVCELQPSLQAKSFEPEREGELSDTLWLVVLPAGTSLRTGDAVTVDAEVMEVVGDPWKARNPRTKTESHVEATLRRTASSDDETGS